MLFNSIDYLLFLPTVVCLYFLTPTRLRWALLLAASYLFYAAWDIAYVGLIAASTLADYVAALGMGRETDRRGRRKWLALSLVVNLGLLFTFKYANFAIDSLRMAADGFGASVDLPTLNLLLPIGISFYTFQTLSYAIDVYRGDREPERHLGKFAVFVAFFPQLVAGPIERSKRLLPQFSEHHRWDTEGVTEGVQRVLWGFFKKLVVADQTALYVNAVFADPAEHGTVTLVLGVWLFAFQVYCDFSGYSDIAIGSARIMGFRLMENFRRPYAGESLADLWRRWHISLTTWFRDYIYFPLGGNRRGIPRWAIATGAVFMVSGVWHGAAWTFVFWGGCTAQPAGSPRAPRVQDAELPWLEKVAMEQGAMLGTRSLADLTQAEIEADARERAELQFANPTLSLASVRHLERLLELCEREGIEVLLVRFPLSPAFREALGAYVDEAALDARLAKIAAPFRGVRTLDFRARFDGRPWLFSDVDHVNEQGAMLLSRAIRRVLEK